MLGLHAVPASAVGFGGRNQTPQYNLNATASRHRGHVHTSIWHLITVPKHSSTILGIILVPTCCLGPSAFVSFQYRTDKIPDKKIGICLFKLFNVCHNNFQESQDEVDFNVEGPFDMGNDSKGKGN